VLRSAILRAAPWVKAQADAPGHRIAPDKTLLESKRIAAKWIPRFRSSQEHGRQAVNSTGGSKSAGSGGVAYAVQTAVNDGSGLLTFVVRRASDMALRQGTSPSVTRTGTVLLR
jgi:hypothetical protein